jgi:hypothetical protein
MVGGVVKLQHVALVGFSAGMGVGTLGVEACWDLLQVCHIYIVEWAQLRGTLVWHGQSKGFVVLLLGVEDAWVQFVLRVQSLMW